MTTHANTDDNKSILLDVDLNYFRSALLSKILHTTTKWASVLISVHRAGTFILWHHYRKPNAN